MCALQSSKYKGRGQEKHSVLINAVLQRAGEKKKPRLYASKKQIMVNNTKITDIK